MPFPSVTINQINTNSGSAKQIARTVLFIAKSSKPLAVTPINAKTDLDKILSASDTLIKSNIEAYFANAGQNSIAYVQLVNPAETTKKWLTDAVLEAQDVVSVEGIVVITDAGTDREQIQEAAALREKLINSRSRWCWFILACAGIKTTETWTQYVAALTTLQKSLLAPAVQLVPLLFGNDPGVLAGRLCTNAVTLADSPARVATGGVKLLGKHPVDSTGAPLDLAVIRTLNNTRFSVPLWYEDYPGIFWADGVTLEADGGDYQVIEYLRVVDEVARRVRVIAIGKIANRGLNSTPASIAANKQQFAKPLREMSKSLTIGGTVFPGECMPPDENSVELSWPNKNSVNIGLLVKPYNSPKQITVSILLDLSED